jgi:hypothetical protein
MRKGIELLSLTLLVAGAGCAREEARESAQLRTADRDLTLQAPNPAVVAIASPVELERPAVHRTPTTKQGSWRFKASTSARPASSSVAAIVAMEPVVVPAPALEPAPEPAPAPVAAGAGRELAPGETVTMIPASAGPSSSDGDAPDMPEARSRGAIFIGHGGGTCHPRGGVGGFRISLH